MSWLDTELQVAIMRLNNSEPQSRLLKIIPSWIAIQHRKNPRLDQEDIAWLNGLASGRALFISSATPKGKQTIVDQWTTSDGDEILKRAEIIERQAVWLFLMYLKERLATDESVKPTLAYCQYDECAQLFVAKTSRRKFCSNQHRTYADRKKDVETGR